MVKDLPHYIYMLINPVNQYPFYIGVSHQVDIRYEQHLVTTEGRKRASIVEYIKSLGQEPILVLLEKKPNRKQAYYSEKFWIELFGSRGIPIANKEIMNSLNVVDFHTKPKNVVFREKSEGFELSSTLLRAGTISKAQKPINHGKTWSQEDLRDLKGKFLDGSSIEDLASIYKRTTLGILSQLIKLSSQDEDIYFKLANLKLLPNQEAYCENNKP